MKRSRLPAILTTLVLVFLNAPLFVLVLNSFNASRFGGSWEGFTWQWYERLWRADDVWQAFSLSLRLATVSTLAATLLGTLAAWTWSMVALLFLGANAHLLLGQYGWFYDHYKVLSLVLLFALLLSIRWRTPLQQGP